MNDTELLIKAAEKLGMTHLENYEGHLWYCDLSKSTNNKLRVPAFLTSLDAHFSPGGTVEWMREMGFALDMFQQSNGWRVVFYKVDGDEDYQSTDSNPARAITVAFVQHEDKV